MEVARQSAKRLLAAGCAAVQVVNGAGPGISKRETQAIRGTAIGTQLERVVPAPEGTPCVRRIQAGLHRNAIAAHESSDAIHARSKTDKWDSRQKIAQVVGCLSVNRRIRGR